jgi:peptide chain release factor 1
MTKEKTLILSVSEKDCEFSYARGTGKGGQKRNKTSTAARCKHIPSGAVGFSDDTRNQHENKRIAFARMIKTQEFNEWHIKMLAKILDICDPNDLKIEIGRD